MTDQRNCAAVLALGKAACDYVARLQMRGAKFAYVTPATETTKIEMERIPYMDQRKRTMLIIRLLAGAGVAVLLWVLVHGTLQQKQYEYIVCMDFQSGSHCATARGM